MKAETDHRVHRLLMNATLRSVQPMSRGPTPHGLTPLAHAVELFDAVHHESRQRRREEHPWMVVSAQTVRLGVFTAENCRPVDVTRFHASHTASCEWMR